MATALSNGPLPANRVVASILSYYETRSTRERVATTRFPRLTTLTMIFRNVSLYLRSEDKLRYLVDVLESREWIFENSLN